MKLRIKELRWPFPVMALLEVCAAVVLIVARHSSLQEASLIMQTAATVALATLTWGYLFATEQMAHEASAQTRASKAMLAESSRARTESIRPFLCFRYTIDEASPSPQVKTWLVNVGRGPAYDITLYWNVTETTTGDGQVLLSSHLGNCLRPSALNASAFGYPLGVDNGSVELRICFVSVSADAEMPTPLFNRNVRALLVYSDLYGNKYRTRLTHKLQYPEVGEPTLEDFD